MTPDGWTDALDGCEVIALKFGLAAVLVKRVRPPAPPPGPDTAPPWEQEPLSVEDSSW